MQDRRTNTDEKESSRDLGPLAGDRTQNAAEHDASSDHQKRCQANSDGDGNDIDVEEG